MDRISMINRIGAQYLTSNIEGGEYSYVQAAGSKKALCKLLNRSPEHFKVDVRMESEDVVVLIETKQEFEESDEQQLKEYLEEENLLHPDKKVICILANTKNDKIKVWKTKLDESHVLKEETVIDTMTHYKGLFKITKNNCRERVLKNTYALNELLHKKDIKEELRSQFVGTLLIYIEDIVNSKGFTVINETAIQQLTQYWSGLTASQIITGISDTINTRLTTTANKDMKLRLLRTKILEDQHVQSLSVSDWVDILLDITANIYAFVNIESAEGQDIMNMFFIAFNKYVGKADKNQAFTPDYMTDFMCRLTNVNRETVVFDGTCGSGSFLVQALVKEFADSRHGNTEEETNAQIEKVKKENIYGVEIDENVYGLAVTNMLIHGNADANLKLGSLFDSQDFIKNANPDVILMNPPYNSKPIGIPDIYKTQWGAAKTGKEDPTKGLVFVQAVSDMVRSYSPKKDIRLAVLLPVSAAIGKSKILQNVKTQLLEHNTLEAVFTLADDMFYPGASVNACCMVFQLCRPHVNTDGTVNKTFFGYFKNDGHIKKKNIGRIEKLDEENNSEWKRIEEEWLALYRNKEVKPGLSAMVTVTGTDEWLCEAYMDTNYKNLTKTLFQNTLNNHFAYMIKDGRLHEVMDYLKNKSTENIELDISNWKTFRLCDLFETIEKGKCNDASSLLEGHDINYIGAKWNDNGLMKTCEMEDELVSKSNCIVMIGQGQGSAGYATYQDKDFIGATSLNIGYASWINFYSGLFVSAVLCLEYDKYSFGRSWTGNRLLNTQILLPADEFGNPDCAYMTQYIQQLF